MLVRKELVIEVVTRCTYFGRVILWSRFSLGGSIAKG